MSETNAVVAIYKTHTGAEEAIRELQRSRIDLHTLSIIGKDTHTDEVETARGIIARTQPVNVTLHAPEVAATV